MEGFIFVTFPLSSFADLSIVFVWSSSQNRAKYTHDIMSSSGCKCLCVNAMLRKSRDLHAVTDYFKAWGLILCSQFRMLIFCRVNTSVTA